MGRHPLCLLLLAAFVASSLATHAVPTTNTSYVVVTSDVLVPGSELLIDLHLLGLTKSDSKEDNEPDECVLDLSVSADDHLWHRSVWKIELDKTPKSFSKTLRVLVSPDEGLLGDKSVLKIESSSCFEFSCSVEVPTGWKELLVSLRTDKLKYRPGELVLMETIVLTQELRPHIHPVNMSIHNSKGVPLVKWLNITAEEGLLREEYFIPLPAQSDELVLTLESHNQMVNHKFYIEQPVGPHDQERFLVEIRSPRYHSLQAGDESKSPNLEFSVVASHHSGAPLEGNVEVQLSLENSSKSGSLPPVELVTGLKVFSLKPHEIKQVLGLNNEKPLVGQVVRVQVKVEEERPLRKDDDGDDDNGKEEEKKLDEIKDKEKEEKEKKVPVSRNVLVTFVEQSHVLFFSEFTPQFFKPGLSYVGQVFLKPIEGMLPGSSKKKEVTIKVEHHTSNSESPREEKLALKLKPNSLGEFSFRVPKEDIKLKLEAKFEDKETGKVVKAHIKILPFSTRNKDGHHVQVLMDQKTPSVVVGETLKVKVESSFPTSEILYQVFCQSGLVLSGKLVATSPATKHDLSLVLPQNASHLLSSPRLVVEVLSPSNEILSDSLRFVVKQKQESPLELLIKSEVSLSGEIVEFVVKAEPFTNVYLLTVSNLVAFEPKEQELRKILAYKKMLRYLRKLKSTHFSRTIDEFGQMLSTLSSLAPDSYRVLNEAESILLTDGLVHTDPSKPWPTPARQNGSLENIELSSLDCIEEFNSNLWRLNVTIGPSGKEILRLVHPVKEKLYTFGAFGVKPGKGLVVVDEPVQCQGYKVVPSESLLLDNFKGEQVLDLDVPKNITNTIEKSNSDENREVSTIQEDKQERQVVDDNEEESSLGATLANYFPEWLFNPSSASIFPNSVKMTVTCTNNEEKIIDLTRITKDEVMFSPNSSLRGQRLSWIHAEEERMAYYNIHGGGKGSVTFKKLNEFQEKLYNLEFDCDNKLNLLEPWSTYLKTSPGIEEEDACFQKITSVRINRVLHLQYRQIDCDAADDHPDTTSAATSTTAPETMCNSTCRPSLSDGDEVHKWISFAGSTACFAILILLVWIAFKRSGEAKE